MFAFEYSTFAILEKVGSLVMNVIYKICK